MERERKMEIQISSLVSPPSFAVFGEANQIFHGQKKSHGNGNFEGA